MTTSKKKNPTYASMIKLLSCESNVGFPAELHGFISGILCSNHLAENSGLGFRLVIERMREDVLQENIAQSAISEFMFWVMRELQDTDLSFDLFLPRDCEPLATRTETLARWCRGFLDGLGIAGITEGLLEQSDIYDALRNIMEVSKLTPCHEENEETEMAYSSLSEFVRMAVLTIYEQSELDKKRAELAH
jgi:hypothetical protein